LPISAEGLFSSGKHMVSSRKSGKRDRIHSGIPPLFGGERGFLHAPWVTQAANTNARIPAPKIPQMASDRCGSEITANASSVQVAHWKNLKGKANKGCNSGSWFTIPPVRVKLPSLTPSSCDPSPDKVKRPAHTEEFIARRGSVENWWGFSRSGPVGRSVPSEATNWHTGKTAGSDLRLMDLLPTMRLRNFPPSLSPIMKTLLVGATLSFAFIVAGCAAPEEQEAAGPPSYTVVSEWSIPNGGKGRTILVNPELRTEEGLMQVSQELRREHQRDRHAQIEIYDSRRAAEMRQRVMNETASTEDEAYYDSHKIGFYQKNSISGHHAFIMALDGMEGDFQTRNLPAP